MFIHIKQISELWNQHVKDWVLKRKMSVSVNRFGNTSAASIPLSIQQELENGRIKDDDTLVLVGFGGGLTWGAMVIKWGK